MYKCVYFLRLRYFLHIWRFVSLYGLGASLSIRKQSAIMWIKGRCVHRCQFRMNYYAFYRRLSPFSVSQRPRKIAHKFQQTVNRTFVGFIRVVLQNIVPPWFSKMCLLFSISLLFLFYLCNYWLGYVIRVSSINLYLSVWLKKKTFYTLAF